MILFINGQNSSSISHSPLYLTFSPVVALLHLLSSLVKNVLPDLGSANVIIGSFMGMWISCVLVIF